MTKKAKKAAKASVYLPGPIECGDRVEDPISGFKGIVIALAFWLHGCARVIVAPEGTKKEDSERKESASEKELWFDAARVGILAKNIFKNPYAANIATSAMPYMPAQALSPQKPGTGGPDREESIGDRDPTR